MKIREEFINAHQELADKIESRAYDFLRENEHLKGKIALLTMGGSYAYGLDVHTPEHESDLDIRGVVLNSKEQLLANENFEQFENRETDTTIYGMKKFISLMTQCNPNIIEMLYCRPQDYIYISPIGQMLLDNRDAFLSQRAYDTFSGFARAQVKRIENAQARGALSEYDKGSHKALSTQNAVNNLHIQHELDDYGYMKFVVTEDNVLKINCEYNELPVSEWINMMNATKQVLADYEKTAGKNKRKDDEHLNKHMSHILRLLEMGYEVLNEHCVHTYREKDAQLLLDVKQGKYTNEDGTFKQEIWDMVKEKEEKLKELKAKTTLPKLPDIERINTLTYKINEATLKELSEDKAIER